MKQIVAPVFSFAIAISAYFYILPHAAGQDKSAPSKPTTESAVKLESPPYRGLDATLYMQTSAEYKACCIQAFRLARILVEHKMAKLEVSTNASTGIQRAVVLDLDETVLDNGWFQSQQIRDKVAFDAGRWSNWEQTGADQVRLVPGAKAFIDLLKQRGIAPVYITNRNNNARLSTMAALNRLGVDVPDDQLLCADDATGTNKTSRREAVSKRFQVLLYVGDNLRDFDERFRFDKSAGAAGRDAVVNELESKFGENWVILPNPAYGEWNKVMQNSEADADLLYK